MKKLIQTFQNIFKIEELKKRILYTLGLLLIYRFGSFVVIPGIDPNALSSLADQVSGTGLLGLLDIFSGGAFANASIFALGVMPYISASIIMQLVGMVIPYFQRMQREGESGRRKMNPLCCCCRDRRISPIFTTNCRVRHLCWDRATSCSRSARLWF